MTHEFPITVFYEDTDMAGIVYYANYLKFIERGRSTMVHDAGVDQLAMQAQGVVFAVRKLSAEYIGSAKLADKLVVRTTVADMSGAKLVFDQRVYRGEDLLFSAEVLVVCLTPEGKATRIPKEIYGKLQQISA